MSEYDDSDEKKKEKQEERLPTDDANCNKQLILKVVEIASAASRTSRLASEAEQRQRRLMDLTQAAQAEVDSIREIARSLTQTASSVAQVALEVCRYSSCQEAFERHSAHCSRLMDLQSFLEIVSNKASPSRDKDARTASDPLRRNECMATVAIGTDVTVSRVQSERVGGAPSDCSCSEQPGWSFTGVNRKECTEHERTVNSQNDRNGSSNPNFRSCSFSCISLSDSSLASSGSGARLPDRERESEEVVVITKQMPSSPKMLSQLQQPSRLESTNKLRGRGCLMEVSSDSEVEEILQRKPAESPTVQKLRNLELRTTDALDCSDLLNQKKTDKQSRRPVSPLLDDSEKDNYAVSGEEVGRNSPKHLFTPPVSVVSSAEQVHKRHVLS